MAQVNISLNVSEQLFLRDPQQTDLGKRMVRNGILLIDEIGFDAFTFKKLASKIKSTEASIYRYFENKHFFFVYLVNWYWEWTSFRISFNTMNIQNPKDKLSKIIDTIVDTSQKRASIDFVNTDVLHRIVVTEGTKAYHGKYVDKENKMGFFLSYKTLCKKIADIILEVRDNYPYPKALASTIIETANNNIYFVEHLPRLTDIEETPHFHQEIVKMLESIVFKALESKQPKGNALQDAPNEAQSSGEK